MRWLRFCLPVLAACFSPRPPSGAICSPEGACPDGQRCVENVCVAATEPDASIVPNDSSPSDAPIASTWTLVQTDDRGNLGGVQSLALTVAPTVAGNTIIVAVESDLQPVSSVTDNAGNTYVQVPNARAVNASQAFGVELWYASSAIGGATTIIASTGNSEVYAIVMWEVAGLATTNVIDASATIDNAPASTTPVGAEVTTSVAGAFVIAIAIVETTVDGLLPGGPFTNDHLTLGNGWAHLTSNTAPPGNYAAQWNQNTSGVYCATTVAFRPAN
jgi:hypothetical protein